MLDDVKKTNYFNNKDQKESDLDIDKNSTSLFEGTPEDIGYKDMKYTTVDNDSNQLDEVLDIIDPIGTIGSPSSTNEININILQNKKKIKDP